MGGVGNIPTTFIQLTGSTNYHPKAQENIQGLAYRPATVYTFPCLRKFQSVPMNRWRPYNLIILDVKDMEITIYYLKHAICFVRRWLFLGKADLKKELCLTNLFELRTLGMREAGLTIF